MNNKGFTLVELLAVMVILAGISLVVVGGITASLDKRNSKEASEQIELAKGAAKIYFSLEDKTCVTIQTLIDKNYISADKKVSKLVKTNTIRLDNTKNDYVYSNARCQ